MDVRLILGGQAILESVMAEPNLRLARIYVQPGNKVILHYHEPVEGEDDVEECKEIRCRDKGEAVQVAKALKVTHLWFGGSHEPTDLIPMAEAGVIALFGDMYGATKH